MFSLRGEFDFRKQLQWGGIGGGEWDGRGIRSNNDDDLINLYVENLYIIHQFLLKKWIKQVWSGSRVAEGVGQKWKKGFSQYS